MSAAANLDAEQPPTQTVLAELGLGAPVFASADCLGASPEAGQEVTR